MGPAVTTGEVASIGTGEFTSYLIGGFMMGVVAYQITVHPVPPGWADPTAHTDDQPEPKPAPSPAAGGATGGEPPLCDELHRPYVQKWVRDEVYRRQKKDAQGRIIDPNTGKPIISTPDLGHVAGHEFWREKKAAEDQCWSQGLFNIYMNTPDFYQYEDPSSNRSHKHEDVSPY